MPVQSITGIKLINIKNLKKTKTLLFYIYAESKKYTSEQRSNGKHRENNGIRYFMDQSSTKVGSE